MSQSIEQAHQEVQSAFAAAVGLADASERRTLAAFESRLWPQLLALGRALVSLFLARQAQRPRSLRAPSTRAPPPCAICPFGNGCSSSPAAW